MMPTVIDAADGTQSRAAEGWDAYLAEPVRDADPQRFAACFRAPGLSPTLEAMAAEPRFSARLASLLSARLAVSGPAGAMPVPVQADLLVARLGRVDFEALALPCGAVFWSGAFVREIRKAVVTAMAERFGEAAFDAALSHRELGGNRPVPADLDALEKVILADGRACLAAWIQSLPEPIGRRVRLKWPDDAAVPATADAQLLARGPLIVRRVAADIHAAASERAAS